jgi:hypothetical protein
MLSIITSPITLSIIMLCIVMLTVVMLSVIMLNVVLLSGMAPEKNISLYLVRKVVKLTSKNMVETFSSFKHISLFTLKSRRYNTQHNDIQHNDIQRNDTQYNDIQHNDTQHNI